MRALLLILLLVAGPLAGQGRAVSARVDPATGGLFVDLTGLLDDSSLRDALHSGLPLRIEIEGELWRDGFFDSQEGGAIWRASVIHDPVRRSYQVELIGRPPQRVATIAEAERILVAAFRMEVRPQRRARYYYLATVEIQTLSISDLEEVRRWLRGDVAPAVSGNERSQGAVASGVRRIFVRALGLPTLRRKFRTPTFQWEAGGGSAILSPAPGSGPAQKAPGQLPGVLGIPNHLPAIHPDMLDPN